MVNMLSGIIFSYKDDFVAHCNIGLDFHANKSESERVKKYLIILFMYSTKVKARELKMINISKS